MRKLTVVVGGQYGSEGKGAITGHLAKKLTPTDVNIRVAGPNAGHTVVGHPGETWKLRQVPVGAVTSRCALAIAAGSEVDLDVLHSEVRQLDEAGCGVTSRMWAHPSATVIEESHKKAESEQQLDLVKTIGSTGKGIGAARADRILRTARTLHDAAIAGEWVPPMGEIDVTGRDHILIEGTQGYGLGLHAQAYPFVTSSDCRAIDFCAMAGVNPWQAEQVTVWVVIRPYPIRVAGNSGPLAHETSWGDLGLPEEFTTVTGKLRRVGLFDPALVHQAVQANGGAPTVRLALTMLDQVFPEVAGSTNPEQVWANEKIGDYLSEIEQAAQAPVALVGTGPRTVIELPERV